MTPAEQARRDVKWWADGVGLPFRYHPDIEALIARLTPIYERAECAEKAEKTVAGLATFAQLYEDIKKYLVEKRIALDAECRRVLGELEE